MLDEWTDLWRDRLRAEGKSTSTIRSYLSAVTAYQRWAISSDQPTTSDLRELGESDQNLSLTRASVAAFIASIDGEDATRRARYIGLRQLGKFIADETGDPDPLAGMKPPSLGAKIVPKLADNELARLIKACEGRSFLDRRDEAIVRLMAESGPRSEEILAMHVDDVDTTRGLAMIRRGKGGAGRIVPFGPKTGLALGRYLRLRKVHPRSAELQLWLGDKGKTLGYHGLYTALRHRADAAGIKGFHPHRLRHTAASRWLHAGGSEGGLMAIAGWKSRDMLDRYVQDSRMEQAADESRRLGLGDI